MVLVHGNRFLLYLILEKIKVIDGFDTQYLTKDNVSNMVNTMFQEYWDKVFSAMEEKFPEAYPAHIFKNVGRLRKISEIL